TNFGSTFPFGHNRLVNFYNISNSANTNRMETKISSTNLSKVIKPVNYSAARKFQSLHHHRVGAGLAPKINQPYKFP
ncbi:hypothetical protein BgiBS90_004582, partial [Biomphalaria glabrata]